MQGRLIDTIEQQNDGRVDVLSAKDYQALIKITEAMMGLPPQEREKKLQRKDATFDEELVIREKDRPSFRVTDGVPNWTDASQWTQLLAAALEAGWLRTTLSAVGRLDDDEGHLGTACLVGPDLIVTNEHVAREIIVRQGFSDKFKLKNNPRIDFKDEDPAAVIYLEKFLRMDKALDLAFFKLERAVPAERQHLVFTAEEGEWLADTLVAVIGFPAEPPRDKLDDREMAKIKKVFLGGYGVKRVAVGKIFKPESDLDGSSHFAHDASTLWGSSGSVVVDLAKGTALGVHFGALPDANFATHAGEVRRLLSAVQDAA